MNQFMQRGQEAVKNNHIAESLEWFGKAVNETPKDPQVLACFGQSLCWAGKRKEGLDYLRSAGKILLKKSRKSRDINLVLDLADQLQHWEDYHGALNLCEQAVKINPNIVRAYQYLALIYLRLNQKKKALIASRKAVKLVPGNAMLEILLATMQISNGMLLEAKNILERVLKNPHLKAEEEFRAHKELASVLDKLGEYEQVFFHLHTSSTVAVNLPEVKRQDMSFVPKMLETYKAEFDSELLGRWESAEFPLELPAPVFVLGFMRTGTTLTQEVLGAHPDIFVADETDLVASMVKELSRFSKHHGSVADQLRQLDWNGVLALREFYWKKARALYGNQLDGVLLLDKTTMNTIDLGLINCIFPDAKVVFLLRDPRDICLSCIMQTMIPTPSTVHLFSWQDTAKFYAQVMEWWQLVKSRLTMGYMELRYEDAVFNFEPTFQKVFGFLGVDWDPSVVDFHKNVAGKYIASPSFNQVAQPLYTSSVGRWQNYQNEYAAISEYLQPFIDSFGYE